MPGEEGRRLRFAVHSVRLAEGGTEVTVFGDLDIDTAGRLREELDAAVKGGGQVVIDLRACPFIDSSGLAALAGAAVRLDEQGRLLVIRGVGERVLRTFEIAGLSRRNSLRIEAAPAPQSL